MKNLRISNVDIISNIEIHVYFTEPLNDIVPSNINILSESTIPNPSVLKVYVIGNRIILHCQPLTHLAPYYLEFKSTNSNPFVSLNNDAIISEDGVSNRYFILGPLENDNEVQSSLKEYLRDNLYNIGDDQTVISKYLKNVAITLSQSKYSIRQAKNENYLSFTVVDEEKVRGIGPFDRLNEESAYDIVRVGRTQTESKVNSKLQYDSFDGYPITLQKQDVVSILSKSSEDQDDSLNITTLVINVNNSPVIKLKSLVFYFNNSNPELEYDIDKLGYSLNESKYDPKRCSTYATLLDNQIKLNQDLFNNQTFVIEDLYKVKIEYEYKNLGKVLDSDSISVYTNLKQIREVLPPISNVFTLKKSPIVNSLGVVPDSNGVTFYNPENPGYPHPAFISEIPFRFNALPVMPGQYAIDYESSTVYVYGESSNDGTGAYPPLATYTYKHTYKRNIDYVYDQDFIELVALPNGSLIDNNGTISFNFEEVLIPNVDYVCSLHKESLNERIDNRLASSNSIKVPNSPITNVFQVFNETSGEIYNVTRWNNDKIYFSYISPPNIDDSIEVASFENILNEKLYVGSEVTNISSVRIFVINLKNNNIISKSEDLIGSSFNTSLSFSDSIFAIEKWFGDIDNLSINEYMVDYSSGVVYLAVSASQSYEIGTASYKSRTIVPSYHHVINLNDIYYKYEEEKKVSSISFGEASIVPSRLDRSDELLYNDNTIYQLHNGYIGRFDLSFVSGLANKVRSVRSVFEYGDLSNTYPINFGPYSSASGYDVKVGKINKQLYSYVQDDGVNKYVLLDEPMTSLSSNITYSFSVIRLSDNAQLWNSSTAVEFPFKLKLTDNSPAVGDYVNITYSFEINDLSRVVIDYDRGDLFVDYTYLADEILVSYEYGDNSIDFRKSNVISNGETYYATYKVGALRNALSKNFGNLINIKQLIDIDVDFDRERYRDALTAALSSFIQGPTVNAIKNIGNIISHIPPDVIEGAFNAWSLGDSLLNPEKIKTIGEFDLVPSKYGNGVLINNDNQNITLPSNSNIRFEEGTFEQWLTPLWNGIDNDAKLSIKVFKDGSLIDPLSIFIGASEDHVVGDIVIDKNITHGTPMMNKNGVFIYYDLDVSNYRWYIKVLDDSASLVNYNIIITSTGSFYDTKVTELPKSSNVSLLTTSNKFTIKINDSNIDEGFTFISDYNHYLLDLGQDRSKSRLSIFKDVGGYLNFRVYDDRETLYNVSANISNWKSMEPHFISASWKLGSLTRMDEMHLFIDGAEVPNIIKFGDKEVVDKYRDVYTEEFIGSINKGTVSSDDLHTTIGSNIVSSSIVFTNFHIVVGDTIYIDEIGFDPSGYTISSFIDSQTLELSSVMPATLTNAKFTVNKVSLAVKSNIGVAPSTAVFSLNKFSTILVDPTSGSDTFTTSSFIDDISVSDVILYQGATYTIIEIGLGIIKVDRDLPVIGTTESADVYNEVELNGINALRPDYSIDGNILTILNGVDQYGIVRIKTFGLNFKGIKEQYYLWSDTQNIIMTSLPSPISLDDVLVKKILLPATAISPSNSSVVGSIYTFTTTTSEPSNQVDGRILSFIINASNVDFTYANKITIDGDAGIETVLFNENNLIVYSTNKYKSINNITVEVKTILPKTACSITVSEKFPITEDNVNNPVVRYSYSVNNGINLEQLSSNSVYDSGKNFSDYHIGNYLVISSPGSVAGTYKINSISSDRKLLILDSSIGAFTGGHYKILNASTYRSGLQNGFFTFETEPGVPYNLTSGLYEFTYNTYISASISNIGRSIFIGTDMYGSNNISSIIDQTVILSTMLKDNRVGEDVANNQRSITKDFNSLSPVELDSTTLVYITYNNFPFTNDANYYIRDTKSFLSSRVINENFNNSLAVLNEPVFIENNGILDTKKEGTIEFWINPLFDTFNDPNDRYYFDAFGAVSEEVVSDNNTTVRVSGAADRILNITLRAGDGQVDYFAGGKLEIDQSDTIFEQVISLSNNIVYVSNPALQIISIKIVGDSSGKDYFNNGVISTDSRTIYISEALPLMNTSVIVNYKIANNNSKINGQVIRLNKKLPNQNSSVIVRYIPKGLEGDRISIYKDKAGHINFKIIADNNVHVISAPTFWYKDTWHRIKASYKLNGSDDKMMLFVDGYSYQNIVFGSDIVYGPDTIFGTSVPGNMTPIHRSIKFKDSINDLYIGNEYSKLSPAFCLIDNFKISNIFRPVYSPFGEPRDLNYGNLNIVMPVSKDLYTTYLSDFDYSYYKNDDFASLGSNDNGSFNFTVNIFDSLNVIDDNAKIKQILETLINVLKPANSKAYIRYIEG